MCGVAGGAAFGPYGGGAVAVGIVERLDRCRGGETATRIPYIRFIVGIEGDNGLSGTGRKGHTRRQRFVRRYDGAYGDREARCDGRGHVAR